MIPVVVVAGVTLLGWWPCTPRGQTPAGRMGRELRFRTRGLPKYRLSCGVRVAMAFVIASSSLGVRPRCHGTPVDTYVKHDKSSSRDIICLDASPMLPYGRRSAIASSRSSHFEGERISLQL